MATRSISVINEGFHLFTQGADQVPFNVEVAGARWQHMIIRIPDDGSTLVLIKGGFFVPDDYVGTPVWDIFWSINQTTGAGSWELLYRTIAHPDTDSLNQAGQEAGPLNVTGNAPSIALELMKSSIALTAAHFTAGEYVQFEFGLDGSDAATTFGTTNRPFIVPSGLRFKYSDT